jgi:dCTP diphosphatase
MDQHTTLDVLKEAVAEFIATRNWQRYHNPKNLALSIAIESAELMEHFQWLTDSQSADLVVDKAAKVEVADELADILIYCLSFANQARIDISEAVFEKLSRNEHRFPKPPAADQPNHQV